MKTIFLRSGIKTTRYLAVIMILSIASSGLLTTPTLALSGSGSQIDPYQISNCQDLQDMQNDLSGYYELSNNIDCASFAGFEPIGSCDTPFMGELNGKGFSVQNLTISPLNSDEDCIGLFGQVGSSVNQVGLVKDFGLEDVSITGDWAVGSLVGVLYGQANNTYSSGTVHGRGEVGGLVGSHGGTWDTIINSYAAVDVTSTDDTIGGLVGYNAPDSQIINSYATGNVLTDGGNAGGLVGVNNGNIEDSHATGNVTSDGGNVGGLVGENTSDGTISNTYAIGAADAKNYNAGGLVGSNYGTVSQSYSNNISASQGQSAVQGECMVGGLVGYNQQNSSIDNSYSRSSVTINTNLVCQVGGFAGTNEGLISKAYSTGNVNGPIMSSAGFASSALNTGSIAFSFWDENTSGQNEACNTSISNYDCTQSSSVDGRSTNDMKDIDTFTTELGANEWDFTNIWSFVAAQNDDYPILEAGATPTSQPEIEPEIHGFISPLTNKPIMLELPSSCTFEAHFKTESELAVKDAAYDYSDGLVGFEAECGTPGITATVSQYYLGSVQQNNRVLRKYNSRIHGFFTINDAVFETVTVSGKVATKVTYTVTDGGERDADGLIDGNISDPAGLANAVVGAPNTGL